MAQDLGGIYYEVDLETKGLMDSVKRAKGGLDSLGSSTSGLSNGLDKAGRSASSTASSFSGLSRVAASLMAILSVQQVAQYADAWTTLNNKLSNAIRPNQQLADVTETVFNITQQTRSSLEATATLYSRLERATRSYGASASELAKLTTIINQGFIVSGATAQEAQNAVIQLSQGLASGALRGQEFNSVNEQGNRLIVALADSMGVTVGKMRELASQGKLTTDVVVKGLLSQGDAIGKEFANTTTTISQALEVAGNNITKFFGENSTVKSGVATFNSSIVSISENIDVLGVALTGVAAIMGSRYVGALTMATQAKVSGVTATIRQQKAEYDNAKATIASAQAEIKNSQAIIASEQAKARQLATQAAINKQYGLSVSYQAEYAAIQKNIVAADNAAAAAKARLAAATQQASVANRVYAASATLLKGALSFIGGPAGAAMLAATAIYYFYQKAQQAKQESIDFADSLDGVIAKMREMNQTQLQGTLGDIAKSIVAQKEKIDDLKGSVSAAQTEYDKYTLLAKQFGVEQDKTNGYVQKANEWFYTLSQRKRDLSDATDKLNKTQQQQSQIQEQLNTKAKESDAAFEVLANNLRTKIPNASEAAIAAMAATMQTLDSLNKKASESGKAAEPEPSQQARKLIQNAERRLALSKLEGEARARLQAQYDAEDVGYGANDPVTKQLQDRYAQTEKNTKAQKEANSEGKKSASATESVAQKLANLKQQSELAAESTRELSREQAILKAQQSLGKAATQDQIKQAGEYAAKTWDVANALKMRQEAEQASRFVNQEVSAAKVQRDPYTGEAVDPYAQVNEEESRKLEALRKYQKLGAVDAQQYEDGKTAIMQQAANERINIAQDESRRQADVMNTLLGGLGDSFSGLADIISKSSGDTSDAYRVLFGIGKGFAVAQAGLNLQLALSNAMASGPFPWNLSAMASVAAAGGSLISSIAGATYGGARKNGGPVSAGEMYRVGEGGMPEIYQASSGKQYMIPGDNGKVISNKDMQGGGGEGNSIVQHITFEINTTGGIDDATMAKMSTMMKQVSLNTIRDQQRPNGLLQRSR